MAGRGNKRVTAEELEVENWKFPDEGALGGELLSSYLSRKRGVRLYFDGATDHELKIETNLSLSHVYKLIKNRCLSIHPDGEVWGWRGLIRNIRINEHQRKTKIEIDDFGMGSSGALKSLLNQYPELRQKFELRILAPSRKNRLALVTKNKKSHYQWFLKELRALGIEHQRAWPFNTEKQGYVSICKYITSVWEANPSKAARIIGGEDAEKKLLSGDGNNRPVNKLLQRVEMDAHKIDGMFCISIPQSTGGYVEKIVHRLWVVVIIEVVSRAVIGYHFSMRREVSKIDVLRAIKMALTEWKKPTISFSDKAYLPKANLPSGLSDEYIGLCWDETSVDGALAETCKTVREALKSVVDSDLLSPEDSFSVRRSKDDRPFIEAFFRQLASWGFQKFSNTTGSNPKSKPVKRPDQVAITSRFQYEYAKEVLDVLIANYNATPHSSLGGRTPLDYFQFRFSRDESKRYADPISVSLIVSFRKLCRVKGGYKTGKLPYVNFQHGMYSNDTLKQRHDLVGSKIWVVTHIEDDIRAVLASTPDGQPLGTLFVRAPWSLLPHSLEIRNSIYSVISSEKLRVEAGHDAVEEFLNYCEQQTDKKLPVHPAYMEARRILTAVAASVTKDNTDSPIISSGNASDRNSGVTGSVARTNSRNRPLPAPRKAAD